MIFQVGQRWKHDGRSYRVQKQLGVGGFGEVWWLVDGADGSSKALKCLHTHDPQYVKRLYHLRDLQLNDRLTGAACVTDVVPPSGDQNWSGYLMPYVPGVQIEEWILKMRDVSVFDCISICLQIAKTLYDVHKLGLAHGDIQPKNVTLRFDGDVFVTSIIDWDNAHIPGMPAPQSPGRPDFLAPEAVRAAETGTAYLPDIKTERASIGKLFHWILFWRSPISAEDPDERDRRAMAGQWDSDPRNGPVDRATGGWPNDWMSPKFADLFRRSLGCDRDQRATMKEWISALLEVVHDGISLCPNCGGPVVVGPRTTCPHCSQDFPRLQLLDSNGRCIRIENATLLIGRDDFMSPRVSRRHATISQFGPETFVMDLGSTHGTERDIKGQWVKLPPKQSCPVAVGDRLRFGDIVVELAVA